MRRDAVVCRTTGAAKKGVSASPGAGLRFGEMSDPREVRPERLDSWKEIAAYLRRDVTTVQRWEKREGMPVHRHRHDKLGSVYAFRAELDEWAGRRRIAVDGPEGAEPAAVEGDAEPAAARPGGAAGATSRSRLIWASCVVAGLALAAALVWWRRAADPGNPLEGARFTKLTDFEGIEQAAAISRDGRFAAFQSDRDGRMDVWMTQIGSGQFVNLTRGAVSDLVNPSVRVLGFSPDGTLVTFWARGAGSSGPSSIGVWAVPLLGGPPRPYLEGAAEYAWTPDGARLVYHTAGPGDPLFLRDSGRPLPARSSRRPPGCTATFPSGRRTSRSCISPSARRPTGWTSGASAWPEARPIASRSTTGPSAIRFWSMRAPFSISRRNPMVPVPSSSASLPAAGARGA